MKRWQLRTWIYAMFAILVIVSVAATPRSPAPSADKPETIIYEHSPDERAPWPILDIYSLVTDSKSVRALTNDGHSHTPSVSPDGQHILFVHDAAPHTKLPHHEPSETDSHHPIELYVMNRDGSNPRLIRRMETAILRATWSPDGKTIAATAAYLPEESAGVEMNAGEPPKPPVTGLFLFPLDGPGEPRLLFRDAFTPAWSPDGHRIAFSARQRGSRWAIHVANVNGSGEIELTDPTLNAGSPVWSPDGRHIAFDAFVGGHSWQEIFTMDEDGSRQRQLTTDYNWECSAPSWSHDGEKIAFYCRSVSSPCGAGVGGKSGKRGGCIRRVFMTSAFDLQAKPAQLTEHDGAFPVFAPQ